MAQIRLRNLLKNYKEDNRYLINTENQKYLTQQGQNVQTYPKYDTFISNTINTFLLIESHYLSEWAIITSMLINVPNKDIQSTYS